MMIFKEAWKIKQELLNERRFRLRNLKKPSNGVSPEAANPHYTREIEVFQRRQKGNVFAHLISEGSIISSTAAFLLHPEIPLIDAHIDPRIAVGAGILLSVANVFNLTRRLIHNNRQITEAKNVLSQYNKAPNTRPMAGPSAGKMQGRGTSRL